MARRTTVFLAISLVLLASTASTAVVEHTFNVAEHSVQRLCRNQVITAVNGGLPGPTINVNEGDTLIVHVKNNSPHNMTIHWHGIFQLQSQWADGPSYITQCPILPKHSYTYKFTVTGQEGTLWWHAHVSLLRATVYGALVIRPRKGRTYPFPIPYKEVPILFGEWWNADVVTIDNQGQFLGIGPNMSDAYTINGQPGDLYQCSRNNTFKLNVMPGKTYLLRIINSAVNNQIFFKLAGHRFTVVGIDATYTKPYDTDVVVTGPGQTTDALFTANQPIGDYYMTTRPYVSAPAFPFNNGSATGIVHYIGAKSSSTPLSPEQPAFNDTPVAHKFYSNLTSLTNVPSWVANSKVKHKMFIAFGLGLADCGPNANCSLNPFGSQFRVAASMNNISFQAPSKLSLLEAFHFGVKGIYTRDFPNQPLTKFDYTNSSQNNNVPFMITTKQTRLKRLKFNDTVEIVLQNTAFITTENHPIHLHGFNFYVLAQGFGNFKRNIHSKQFNVVDPQERNTIAVPVGGWAVIRFRADNPGIWFMHCHLDTHLPWGLGTAFEVGNGPTPSTTLPPPPHDLPKC